MATPKLPTIVLVATRGVSRGLTLLEPQSRFGDKPRKFQVVCPQNGTAVLKGSYVRTYVRTAAAAAAAVCLFFAYRISYAATPAVTERAKYLLLQ